MLTRRKLLTLLAVWAYMLALNWAYVREISPLFGYYGHTYVGPRPWGVTLIANLLASAPVFFLPTRIRKPSSLILWILYAVVVIPTTLVPFYSARVPADSLLLFCAVITGCLFLLTRITGLRPIRLRGIELPPQLFSAGILAASLAVYGYLSLRFQLGLRIESLVDVYDTRASYRETLGATSGIAAYMVGWQANVINPLVIAIGLTRNRPHLVALGTIAQLVIFSFTGFKSVFFSALFLFVLLILLRGKKPSIGFRIMAGLSTLILASVAVDTLIGGNTMTSIFVRRLLVVPGQLSGYYLDFFSEQPLARLGHSVLSPIFDYPYSVTPPRLIGQYYFGNVDTSANAHIWADGFANFGYVGVISFSLLLGTFLWIFDSASRFTDLRVSVLLLGIPAFSLSNSALLTTLFSHGMLLALLIILLMSAPYREGREKHSIPSRVEAAVGS